MVSKVRYTMPTRDSPGDRNPGSLRSTRTPGIIEDVVSDNGHRIYECLECGAHAKTMRLREYVPPGHCYGIPFEWLDTRYGSCRRRSRLYRTVAYTPPSVAEVQPFLHQHSIYQTILIQGCCRTAIRVHEISPPVLSTAHSRCIALNHFVRHYCNMPCFL